MAAIEGFELSISGGDAVVADGLLDEVAIAGATLDAAALADGTADIVVDSGSLAIKDAMASGDVKIGEATIGTGAVTAVSLAGRGDEYPVSADI